MDEKKNKKIKINCSFEEIKLSSKDNPMPKKRKKGQEIKFQILPFYFSRVN